MGVVVVEPLDVFGQEIAAVDGARIKGAERQRLETEEAALRGFLDGQSQENVLQAHTKGARTIHSGFVRHDHAWAEGHEGAGAHILANLVRPLVNAEARTHTVARAVTKVKAILPQVRTAHGINLQAHRALGIGAQGQGDVGAEHERIDAALLVRERAEGDGARDVGGAVLVLRTAVQQQQTAGCERCGGVGIWFVVDNGTIRPIGSNGGETQRAEAVVFGAEGRQAEVNIVLRQLLARGHRFVQPAHEAHHRHTIALHRTAETVHLGGVLHRAQQWDGRIDPGRSLVAAAALQDGAVHAARQEQFLQTIGREVCPVLVPLDRYIIGRKVCARRVRYLGRINKEGGTTGCQQKIGEDEGIVVHIGTADIQQPSDFAEVIEQATPSSRLRLLGQALAHLSEFVCHTLARIGLGLHDDGRLRTLGAVGPEEVEGVGRGLENQVLGLQALEEVERGHLGNVAHGQGAREVLGEAFKPLGRRGHIGFALAHQVEGRAREFLLGLEEIARVGP